MRQPRHGQWVFFDTPERPEGAHQANNGSLVGIYERGGRDIFGEPTPTSIVPVAQDTGENLRDDKGQRITFSIDEITGLTPITAATKDQIPEGRRRHHESTWAPRP